MVYTSAIEIDAFIHEDDLATHVEFIGLRPEGRLLAAPSLADTLIPLSDFDFFPIIMLEAIGCGVFPICKDRPGARLITQN
jgi:glycosyltransferase involved in cell wall biosynthesis